MSILVFDPGTTKGHAWAYFSCGLLEKAGRGPPLGLYAELVLIELPRWHKKAGSSPAIVNDLIDLGVAVGELKREYQEESVELVPASRWKGQVPKEIMCQRIYEALSAEERALLPLKRGRKKSCSARDHDHNVLDAVGFGLWKLGRLHGTGR